eukprot:5673661-Lingulodinium_polyedra.AAC.1
MARAKRTMRPSGVFGPPGTGPLGGQKRGTGKPRTAGRPRKPRAPRTQRSPAEPWPTRVKERSIAI